MWSIAMRIMRNPEDAADALQDAYIAAFRRAGTYRGEAQEQDGHDVDQGPSGDQGAAQRCCRGAGCVER
ncbi:MAG TPA: sigma factor [Propionibacteriaceae bacterium]